MPEPLLAISGLARRLRRDRNPARRRSRRRPGEIVAVLGSNGAGKSTLNRTISGVHARRGSGAIRFDDDGDRARARRRTSSRAA